MINRFDKSIQNKIFPLVPLFNESIKPVVAWSKEENLIKNNQELKQQGNLFEYKDKQGRLKKGKITGFVVKTGKDSDILVVDLDKNKGIETYKNLLESLELSEAELDKCINTFTVETPNGGNHLYFRYQKDLINHKNNMGISIYSDGGLVAIPGSKRKIKENETIKEYKLIRNYPIQDMSEKLFKGIKQLFQSEDIKKINKEPQNTHSINNEKQVNNELFEKYINNLIYDLRIRNIRDLLHFGDMFNHIYMNPKVDKETLKKKITDILNCAKPVYCTPKGAILNGSLVKYILEETSSYVKGNMLFMYNPKKGIYEYKDIREQQKIYLEKVILDEDIDSTKAKKFADTILLLADNYEELCFYENRYVNCLNGILDIETNELLQYTPDIKIDTQFNANYIDDDSWKRAYENSKFKDFLETILDKDTILTLQEAWGVMLAPNSSKIQQCFIYLGEGSNGKSSLFDIQESLVGDKDRNICGISLGSFQDEFILSMAEGRRVNIVRDDKFDNRKKIGGVFKSVVCGEEVTVNKKGKNHVRLKFNIAWYYGLNRLAITDDKSHGFFRRPVIIPFKVRFGKTQEEIDRGDADKLAVPGITDDIIKNELDICFNWALEGLMRLKNNGWRITQSEASLKEMEEYKEESDTAYAFYKEKLIKRKGNKINAKQLYDSYKDWCLSESLSPMNPTQFGRQMSSFGHKKYKSMGRNVFPEIDYNSFILVEGEF